MEHRRAMLIAAALAFAAVMTCGCAYRIVPAERDRLIAQSVANIHEAAVATERGVAPSKTMPAIRKACVASLKALGYHMGGE